MVTAIGWWRVVHQKFKMDITNNSACTYLTTQHISQKKDPLAFVNEAQMSIHVSNQKKTTTLDGDVKKALFGRITTQNA
jgi:hypothetical protein